MHNLAKREYNDPDLGIMRIPYSPFEYYKIPPQPASMHKNKSVALIQKMIDTRRECSGRERLGVDTFLLSFAMLGMNSPDMYAASKPQEGVIIYNRQKTKEHRADRAEMRVFLEPCIQPIIAEYEGRDGIHAFNFYDRYSTFDNLTHAVNIGLKQWCDRYGVQPFTLYSARHSWGTIACSAKCKVDMSVVNNGLCHVDRAMRVTNIYVEKDWSLIWEANRKVLALFDWSKL